MTDRASIEKLVQDAYAARAAKDLESISRIFRPDAVFELAGSPHTFPAAARVTGHAQLLSTVQSLIQTFDFLEQKMLTSVIEGDKAAVHWRVKIKHNPTGHIFDTELFDLWTIEDGRVASLVQFCDTALVASIVQGRVAGG
jgi:ketosteroid isomerase-like protein